MYQHFVCFKFKENSPPEALQQHMDQFEALKDAIPEIVSYAGGKTYTGGESVEKFDTAHNVTFRTKEDIEIYIHHPAHQSFIEANQTYWEEVLVVDSEITSGK